MRGCQGWAYCVCVSEGRVRGMSTGAMQSRGQWPLRVPRGTNSLGNSLAWKSNLAQRVVEDGGARLIRLG